MLDGISVIGFLPHLLAATDLGRELVERGSDEPARGASFLVLLAFLVSFVLVRTNTRIIRSQRISWWPGNIETEGGLHIHHLVWGISLLLLCGFLAFATDLHPPWWQITAVGFGIGAGLTLDEFALWLHLQDVYWSDQGRSSVDAVVIAALFGGLVVVGVEPFGLDEPASAAGTIALVATNLVLASLTFLKGRLALGVVAVFVPLVGLVCAVRLAKPDSPWARWVYTGRRSGRLDRARRRFSADRRTAALGRRLQDLIGGTSSS
ncbi:MAG TPA: hypothetical protein VK387_02065 [Thermoleophilaceae bacterium]|nr:hypothetical protein [Thermoleophilaceae bacterium]